MGKQGAHEVGEQGGTRSKGTGAHEVGKQRAQEVGEQGAQGEEEKGGSQ